MSELLTAAQMRSLEQAAIDSGVVTGLELMERAGQGVVDAIFEEWPELRATSHRAVVLCGPGNNGGDGFVVARLLKDWGWEVEVFLYGDPEKLPPDARVNYERWIGTGNMVAPSDTAFKPTHPDGGCDLLVDAVFGIGLSRPLPPLPGQQIYRDDISKFIRFGSAKTVAIDVPSGLEADSGRILTNDPDMPDTLFADLTVTFAYPKVGHIIGNGPEVCGKLRVADIGIATHPPMPRSHWNSVGWVLYPPRPIERPEEYVGLEVGAKILPLPYAIDDPVLHAEAPPRPFIEKRADTHKYHHGHAVILCGGPGRGGAARLAARGALRIGTGLVTVACPPAALPENAARLDAIMLRTMPDADALAHLLTDSRLNALCLGPGLGLGDHTAHLVVAALKSLRATVLDADALTQFRSDPTELFNALHENVVLTPHAGEFARLFPDIAEKLDAPATKGPAYSKVDATRGAAKRAGCTILFKGPDTVIADQTGAARINSSHYDRAAPWLATAGSGDVLAGFITGLLARGFAPLEAAASAAWLHVECALSFGPGLIAEDLPEELPKVFRTLDL